MSSFMEAQSAYLHPTEGSVFSGLLESLCLSVYLYVTASCLFLQPNSSRSSSQCSKHTLFIYFSFSAIPMPLSDILFASFLHCLFLFVPFSLNLLLFLSLLLCVLYTRPLGAQKPGFPVHSDLELLIKHQVMGSLEYLERQLHGVVEIQFPVSQT